MRQSCIYWGLFSAADESTFGQQEGMGVSKNSTVCVHGTEGAVWLTDMCLIDLTIELCGTEEEKIRL